MEICFNCPCDSKHCEGQLYIQPDHWDNGEGREPTEAYLVTVIDFNGSEEGSTYLNRKQIERLIKELKILIG